MRLCYLVRLNLIRVALRLVCGGDTRKVWELGSS